MTAGGLRYYGGKHPYRGLCKWIVDQLPWDQRSTYIEPFAGMLGVLLARDPVNSELVNDANGRIVNWWCVVRDHPEEFGQMLELTHQRSRDSMMRSRAELDHEDPIRRAVAFTVVIQIGLIHTDGEIRWRKNIWPVKGHADVWGLPEVRALHERTRYLQIENCDAVNLLQRVADQDHVVAYVDPPYRTAYHSCYGHVPDWDALTGALRAQKGQVAISGYRDEWDHLGWRVEEFQTHTTAYNATNHETIPSDRIERLWMNYDPPQPNLFDGYR